METSSSYAYKLRAERFKKELEIAERRNDKLSWANRDLSLKLFEADQRGTQLAMKLGFKDIIDAESIISQDPIVFNRFHIQEQSRSLERLKIELNEQQQVNSGFQKVQRETLGGLQKVIEDNSALSRELKRPSDHLRLLHATVTSPSVDSNSPLNTSSGSTCSSPTATALLLELNDLRHRYDSLLEAKERAAASYKRDYRKWRDYKKEIYGAKILKKEGGTLRLSTKRIKIGVTGMEQEETKDKENVKVPTAIYNPIPDAHPFVHPSASRESPSYRSILGKSENTHSHIVAESSVNSATNALKRKHVFASSLSSETEGDSRGSVPIQLPRFPVGSLECTKRSPADATWNSSDTEDDSQSLGQPASFKIPALSTGTHQQLIMPHKHPNYSDDSNFLFRRIHKYPAKARSDGSLIKKSSISPTLHHLSAAQIKPHEPNSAQQNDDHKGGNRTSYCTSEQGLTDYSGYKGRGRYAPTEQADGNTTINAQYEIDTNRNGGLDFQYDAVVRNREDRRQLDAGDCECCRDYYKAIGPLPQRLQQPLWRSPTSQVEIPVCQRNNVSGSMRFSSAADSAFSPSFTGGQHNIELHKKEISRHRHNWERATTPPGYWNIGFPSTQEATDINEKAKEMHQQKLEMVDREAKKTNGRYRKRQT